MTKPEVLSTHKETHKTLYVHVTSVYAYNTLSETHTYSTLSKGELLDVLPVLFVKK